MDFRRPLRAVTPTLDGDVLAVLAGAEAEFTGREVHRLVRHGSERGGRNALDRLAEQGVVSSRAAGRAKLYGLNREHLAAPWAEGLTRMRSELLDRLSETVESWELRPDLAFGVGSVARGDASEESGPGLLVVRPAGVGPGAPVWEGQFPG